MDIANATAATPLFSLASRIVSAKVVECYDGDTFKAVLPLGDALWKFDCRMAGYDTPEMKPPKSQIGREQEKMNAKIAKRALLSRVTNSVLLTSSLDSLDALVALNKRVIQLSCKEFDKYGRLLVEVVEDDGTSVNDWMVAGGYGYKYNGGTKERVAFNAIS
jgi:endonuclease YncB( thermonuclease family)